MIEESLRYLTLDRKYRRMEYTIVFCPFALDCQSSFVAERPNKGSLFDG